MQNLTIHKQIPVERSNMQKFMSTTCKVVPLKIIYIAVSKSSSPARAARPPLSAINIFSL